MDKDTVACDHLKSLMEVHGLTVNCLANRINISPLSLHLKINGNMEWLFWEMIEIKKIFNASHTHDIFPELYESAAKSVG